MTVMDDESNYCLTNDEIDYNVLYLALEYFYQVLYDRYLTPVFNLLELDFNHNDQIKILGKEGFVLWLNVH